MHLATQTLEPTQTSSRQAAANDRLPPLRDSLQNADAHATRNSSLLPVVTREFQPRQKAALSAKGAFATLPRLAIRRDYADRNDRGKIASFRKEAVVPGFRRVQQFSRGHAPLKFAAQRQCSRRALLRPRRA